MPRNIEIKARISSVQSLLPLAQAAALQAHTNAAAHTDVPGAGHHTAPPPQPIVIDQDDTFFPCPNGRLKLRTFSPTSGELIFYTRSDQAGPKTSDYRRVPTDAPDALREALTLACGLLGRVRKRRLLVLAGRTRIHLDEVEGLGAFLELEVVLRDSEPEQAGVEEAHRLMRALGVQPQDLVEGAYLDLLPPA